MNYELAKRLKEAGFPQKNFPVEFECVCGGNKFHPADGRCSAYLVPLEELIEACGDAFFALHKNLTRDGYVAKTGILGEKKGEGKTTSEAVARLWLALNKN